MTFKNNSFYNNPSNEFLTTAGHNFIVDGQDNGRIYIWERTRSLVVKNCINVNITLQGGGQSNIVRHGVYKIFNNNFTSGSMANNLCKNNICTGSLSGSSIYNCTLVSLSSGSSYSNCIIKPTTKGLGFLSQINMINCDFIPDNPTIRYVIHLMEVI